MQKRLVWLAVLATTAALAACGQGAGGKDAEALAKPDQSCSQIDLAGQPPDQPVKIRVGHGAAAEEPFWLMKVKPENTKYQGKWYDLEYVPFRGSEERLTAYQAGDLEAVVTPPEALIRGTARGSLSLAAIVTVMRESEPEAFSSSFVALEGSGIRGVKDLKGKTIGIVDVGSHIDFLARKGVADGGFNPESDAKYVVLPFPAQEDALRGRQIDVASLPEPFYSGALAKGGLAKVVDAADVTGFPFDLLTIAFDRDFVAGNVEAVCAFREDFASSMAYYKANKEEARTALAETEFVPLPAEVYVKVGDYARPERGRFDKAGMERLMEQMIEFDVIEEADRIDVNSLVVPGVTQGE